MLQGEQRLLKEIVLVGLGLHDEKGISLQGLEEAKTSDRIFIELYTSLLPGFSAKRFEKLSGKKLHILSRRELEDENGRKIFDAAEKGKVALLVPGDPLIATTHIALRIEAQKRGVKTRIVHGASALSAVIGLSGLHSYKFGRVVTIPFPDETRSETPYEVITKNMKLGLHTICLLDIKAEQKHYLTIPEAADALSEVEQKRRKGTVTRDTLAVGIAQAGSNNPTVKADFVRNLRKHDFGDPPQTLIFPGKLHFTEAEALIALAGAPEELMETAE